ALGPPCSKSVLRRTRKGGEDQDRKQEIGRGTCQHHQKSLPDGSNLESAITQLLRDVFQIIGIARRSHVADELHVAAERQPRNPPPSALPVGPAENLPPESDREGLGRNPEHARDQIVAELVEKDERSQCA